MDQLLAVLGFFLLLLGVLTTLLAGMDESRAGMSLGMTISVAGALLILVRF